MVVLGCIGCKVGKGFYDYLENGKKVLWFGLVIEYFKVVMQFDVQMLVDCFIIVQVVEIVCCFDEGVVIDLCDVDVGVLFGWGFFVFCGGLVLYIYCVGVGVFVQLSDWLVVEYGCCFVLFVLLCDMVDKGIVFYEC